MRFISFALTALLVNSAYGACEAVCVYQICDQASGVCSQGGQNVASHRSSLSLVSGNSYQALQSDCRELAEGSLQSDKEIVAHINLYQSQQSRVRSAYLQTVWRIYDIKANAQNSCN